MKATDAATVLNHIIKGATTMPVVLGTARPTSRQAQEPKRPYFRLIYQRMSDPTPIPGRLEGQLAVYCYGVTPEEAWHEANALTTALGLTHGRRLPGTGALADFSLASGGWELLPDPTGGGLVFCQVTFAYYG
jgi:hypothetical protein